MKRETHYVHHLRYSSQERLTGLFVLSALVIITVLLLLSSENMKLLQGRVEFIALMRNPVGVSTDTRVHISGIEAGSVKRIALMPDNRFKIVLSIYKEYRSLVRSDSEASISKLALIGDAVIDISSGSPEQPLLEDGSLIKVREAMTLDQILASMRPMLDKINISIDKIAAVLSVLPEDAIRSTLEDTAAITAQLRQGVHDSRGMMVQLKETADILHHEIQTLPEVAQQTRDLIDDTRKTVDAIGNTWPISTNMPADDSSTEPEVMASND